MTISPPPHTHTHVLPGVLCTCHTLELNVAATDHRATQRSRLQIMKVAAFGLVEVGSQKVKVTQANKVKILCVAQLQCLEKDV